MQLVKHLVRETLILWSLPPGLGGINVADRDEGFNRRRERSGRAGMPAQPDDDERGNTLTSQRDRLLSVGATIMRLIELTNMRAHLCIVVVVRDISGPDFEEVM